MKAFQLKVMIKNSKPPVWRRVVVPEEILFSQLSLIFNKIMGWGGASDFEMIFPSLDVCLLNGVDEREGKDTSFVYSFFFLFLTAP